MSPSNASKSFAAASFALAVLAICPAQAEPGASSWVHGQLSKVRLIAGSFDGKSYHAGVEIRLKGRAHTYWRNPGDGGVPPVFSFAGSDNLTTTKVKFPAPERSGKPGEQIIGYANMVIFPMRLSPQKPGRPVKVNLKLHYAACEKICVPEMANLKMTLSPKDAFPGHASSIARYEAAVPASFDSRGAPKLSITPLQPGKISPNKAWRAELQSPGVKAEDLFIEAPELWYFVSKRAGDNSFIIRLVQKPEKAERIPPLRLTLTSSKKAYEGSFSLP